MLLTQPAFTVNFLLQNFILKIVCTNCLVLSCHYCTFCFSLDFSQRCGCSISNSFLSKLRGNFPCSLFPCHLSFVISNLLSFIFLVSPCTSVFRHLAVCNTAESELCWCVLTTCISGSYFLSTYSTNFVISTVWAASNCIMPLPPCFLGTYK